jgi:hypothetical protein
MPVVRHMTFGAGLTVACCVSLSGCAKAPDQQVPIDLKPGQYAVEVKGNMMGMSAGDSGTSAFPKSLCLAGTTDDIIRTTSSLFTAFLPTSCTIKHPERHGNAITASSSCPLDAKSGEGTSTISYDAVVVADGIDGSYGFKINLQHPAGNANQRVESAEGRAFLAAYKLETRFRRTGDCTGGSGSAALPRNPWANK